jgi:hypothetical protein
MMMLPEPAGRNAMPYGTQRRRVSSRAQTGDYKPQPRPVGTQIPLRCHMRAAYSPVLTQAIPDLAPRTSQTNPHRFPPTASCK